VQLSGLSLQGRLQWVGGAYFQYNKPTDTPEFDVTEPIQQANGSFASTTIVAQGGTTERSYAAYGQASYELAGLSPILKGLKVTAGYRYTWDLESAFSNLYIPQFGNACALTSGSTPNCMLNSSALFQAPTWTLALEDQIGSHTFVYVTGRRGYKSGGFNLLTPLQSLYSNYQPEHVTDVEVGLKSDWKLLGMPIRSDVDAFHDDYADIQRIVAVQADGITSAVVENAAAATIEGIELRSVAKPTNLIDLSLNYSYLNAKYTRYISPLSGDLSRLTFPFTARNKVSLGASYRLPLASGLGELSVSANYSYQSSINGAVELDLSEMTVKVHRGQVMRKMRARSVPELVRIADRLAGACAHVAGDLYQDRSASRPASPELVPALDEHARANGYARSEGTHLVLTNL
jgi:iron complex outermembrane receptor protein